MDDVRVNKDVHTAMSDRDFRRLSKFIHSECGIKLPRTKKSMLEARIRKRLNVLKMKSFREYCDYVFSPEGMKNEIVHMIDVVTTNKTDFFRESKHFDYLVQTVLPELVGSLGAGISRRLMLWSAGCSTGEEPYTLAMVLSEFGENYRKFQYSILATDISTKALEEARLGIYSEDRVEPIPLALKRKYLLRSKDRSKGLVRVAPALRKRVEFKRLNFMDKNFGIREQMDIIFCRNVIIYFDRPTQEIILNRLCRHLRDGGYIFMGHSETLSGLNVPLVPVFTTVYRKSL